MSERPRHAVRRIRAALLVALFGYGIWMSVRAAGAGHPRSDFHGWYAATERLFEGERVYFPQLGPDDEMPNKHGLAFLVLFRPFLLLGEPGAQAAWVLLSTLCLAHTVVLLSRMLAPRCGAPWLGLLLVGPFVHTLYRYQQTGLFLLWLFVLGTALLARRRDVPAGMALGVAAAIKLLPLALLPWLLFKRRLRAAGGFLLGVGVSLAVPLALFGLERTGGHLRDYGAMLGHDAAIDSQYRFHQSLRPLVLATISPELVAGPLTSPEARAELAAWQGTRNFLASPSLFAFREAIVTALSLLFVLLCAWAIPSGYGARARAQPPPAALVGEVGLVLGVMLLISPLAWKHYYVWLLPAAGWLVATRGRSSYTALAAFLLLLTLPHKGVIGRQLAVTYQTFHGYAAGLAVVLVLLARALRARSSAGGAG